MREMKNKAIKYWAAEIKYAKKCKNFSFPETAAI